MLIGNATMLKCPYCGATKEVVNLLTGNTFGGKNWSDTKDEFPMLPTLSPIQWCPESDQYYFLHQAE